VERNHKFLPGRRAFRCAGSLYEEIRGIADGQGQKTLRSEILGVNLQSISDQDHSYH